MCLVPAWRGAFSQSNTSGTVWLQGTILVLSEAEYPTGQSSSPKCALELHVDAESFITFSHSEGFIFFYESCSLNWRPPVFHN